MLSEFPMVRMIYKGSLSALITLKIGACYIYFMYEAMYAMMMYQGHPIHYIKNISQTNCKYYIKKNNRVNLGQS